MSPPSPFGVVILGAGASSRMGRPKLLLSWNTTTVIGHIISQWRALGASQITVVQRENDTSLTDELNRLNISQADCIKNPHPDRGMFSSILCAANWHDWKPEISSFVITLGDQPQIRPETLRGLLKFHTEHPDAVCQPEFQGRPKHPVLLPRDIFYALKNTAAETLKDYLKLIPCPAVSYRTNDSTLALDLDTPEDYIRAKNLFSA
ncbi:MAG TPA: nucleotidyltransferase family protein [Verrucomicrobiae bacterium]|jgi:molybdenum cofactor cytidylyltransferase|nr:nucleotidyltransferase family protein [Verrucomicrobiae bacterium]